MPFSFSISHLDGAARRGRLETPHGAIDTPAFMPVGTQGAVKALTHQHLEDAGAQIILGNTYHLHLRPGDALIGRLGGLHRFTGWRRPILTDSGGYQVFSLADRRTVTEAGVEFQSHIDGSRRVLSPEIAVDIQARLGPDIAMVFDECLPYPVDRETARTSVLRTARWARRGRDHFLAVLARGSGPDGDALPTAAQAQFGIVQGSVFP